MTIQTELQVLLGFILGSMAFSVQHFGIRLHSKYILFLALSSFIVQFEYLPSTSFANSMPTANNLNKILPNESELHLIQTALLLLSWWLNRFVYEKSRLAIY